MFDVCVIGHVTKDIIKRNGDIQREIPGGTAYYTSMALKSLNLDVAVITRVAKVDQHHVLRELTESGIVVFCQESDATTRFENIYGKDNLDERTQRVRAIATPFAPTDMPQISAAIIHVGPLTSTDVSAEFLEHLSRKVRRISLDVQGLLREIIDGEVRERDWKEKERGLSSIDVLKANEHEARILSREHDVERAAMRLADLGPTEIVITRGSRGSLIFADGRHYRIPPVPPRKVVDPTGCGDTYMAGYLYQRLQSRDIAAAGRFGAAIATAKLERFGALKRKEVDLEGIGHNAG